jgi:peptidyl-prolyl cis-trans isomerase C
MNRIPFYAMCVAAGFAFSLAANPALAEQTPPPAGMSQPPPQAETIDPQTFPDVVAKVEGTEITRTELIDRAQMVRARLNIQASTADFYRTVLDEMVGSVLLHQAGVAKGYIPTEAEITSQIDSLRTRFPNEEEFTKELNSQGLTLESLRTMMTKDMAIEQLIETDIAPRAQVSEAEKKKFYDENGDQMKRPEQAHVSHILVKAEPGSSPEVREQAKAKAEDLYQRIVKGEDFATLARENSDDEGSKANGGDLSWMSRGQTVPPFEEAAFALKPGEVSDVVETRFGYHIIKLAEIRPEGTMAYEEVQERIGQFLGQQRLQQEIESEVNALRAKANVEILI